MKISTEIISFSKYKSIYETLKLLKDFGFDAYDFTMYGLIHHTPYFVDQDNYLEEAHNIRKYADLLGISCNQTHSFYPTVVKDNQELTEYGYKLTIRCLEITSILGAKYCIVHPCNKLDINENIKMYNNLLPYAKKYNVIMAIENMWLWDKEKNYAINCACSSIESFNNHFSLLNNEEYFVACLDIGHAEMIKDGDGAPNLIKSLGSRLKCLHIHDNFKFKDSHLLPGDGCIDFDKITTALADINYDGDITFEAKGYIENLSETDLNTATKRMYEVGLKLKKEIEYKKSLGNNR